MPQISLYVDRKTLDKIEQRARQEHSSISKWVGGNLRKLLVDGYPEDYFALFGAITDPTLKKPEASSFLKDARRVAI